MAPLGEARPPFGGLVGALRVQPRGIARSLLAGGLILSAASAVSLPPETGPVLCATGLPGCGEEWVARFDGSGGYDHPFAMALDPGRGIAYVGGVTVRPESGQDFVTLAYETRDGALRWVSVWDDPGLSGESIESIAVSPDGGRVFVSGNKEGPAFGQFTTVTQALNASTGTPLWTARYVGTGQSGAHARAMALSPDGATVFAGAAVRGSSDTRDFVVVAYESSTGLQRWEASIHRRVDDMEAMAVSRSGSLVYVTGSSWGVGSGSAILTAALDANTGTVLWTAIEDNANGRRLAAGLDRVFVTGTRLVQAEAEYRTLTLAYADDGRKLWASEYDGPGAQGDIPFAIAVGPDGAHAYVAVMGDGGPTPVGTLNGPLRYYTNHDYVTLSLNASTGAREWVSRYDGPGNYWDLPTRIAVSSDGTRVYVTGWSIGAHFYRDFATISIDSTSGCISWIARYGTAEFGHDGAFGLSLAPDGDRAFVTGVSYSLETGYDVVTIAYRTIDRDLPAPLCPVGPA